MAKNTYQQSMLNKSRADKFLLVFDIPPLLKEYNAKWTSKPNNINIISETVQFSIFGAAVPEITVPAIDNRYAGNTLYVSSHSKNAYPPVTVNFNIDNEYKNYWTIYQWINLMHDERTGKYNESGIEPLNVGPLNHQFTEYRTDLTIYGKDEFNNNRIKFTYKQAFPTTIEAVEYNYQTPNEISSGFTFVYSQMWIELVQ